MYFVIGPVLFLLGYPAHHRFVFYIDRVLVTQKDVLQNTPLNWMSLAGLRSAACCRQGCLPCPLPPSPCHLSLFSPFPCPSLSLPTSSLSHAHERTVPGVLSPSSTCSPRIFPHITFPTATLQFYGWRGVEWLP